MPEANGERAYWLERLYKEKRVLREIALELLAKYEDAHNDVIDTPVLRTEIQVYRQRIDEASR